MKYFYLSLIALFLFSCGSNKVVESRHKNGNPKIVHIYENAAKKDGQEIRYFENGKVEMEGKLKNNNREGKWVAYYGDGTVWSEGTYVNGKREGEGIVYHSNGKIYSKGFWKNDEPVGIWEFFDDKGNKVQEDNLDAK